MATDEQFQTLVESTIALARHAEAMENVVDTLRLYILAHMKQCNRDLNELAFYLPVEAREMLKRDSVLSDASRGVGDHKDDLSGI